jgi:hypothetical protein
MRSGLIDKYAKKDFGHAVISFSKALEIDSRFYVADREQVLFVISKANLQRKRGSPSGGVRV